MLDRDKIEKVLNSVIPTLYPSIDNIFVDDVFPIDDSTDNIRIGVIFKKSVLMKAFPKVNFTSILLNDNEQYYYLSKFIFSIRNYDPLTGGGLKITNSINNCIKGFTQTNDYLLNVNGVLMNKNENL